MINKHSKPKTGQLINLRDIEKHSEVREIEVEKSDEYLDFRSKVSDLGDPSRSKTSRHAVEGCPSRLNLKHSASVADFGENTP